LPDGVQGKVNEQGQQQGGGALVRERCGHGENVLPEALCCIY
jgi:hypothetical protein